MSGANALRRADVTARALSRPDFTSGNDDGIPSNAMSTCPPAKSVITLASDLRNRNQRNIGSGLEQVSRELGDAGRVGDRELAWISFRGSDQIGDGVVGRIDADEHEIREAPDENDRLEVLDGVVGQLVAGSR